MTFGTFDGFQIEPLWKMEILQKLLLWKFLFTKVIKNTQLLFLWTVLYNIFMRQTLTDDFWGLHKNMNCTFPLKMMKNPFYFMLKAISILEMFIFLFWPFGYVENRLKRRLRLISNFIASQAEQQVITIHILSNISRQLDNEIWSVNRI